MRGVLVAGRRGALASVVKPRELLPSRVIGTRVSDDPRLGANHGLALALGSEDREIARDDHKTPLGCILDPPLHHPAGAAASGGERRLNHCFAAVIRGEEVDRLGNADFRRRNGVGEDALPRRSTSCRPQSRLRSKHRLTPQCSCRWWIEDQFQRGFVIITGDLAIFEAESERETVVRAEGEGIGYARADYTGVAELAGFNHACQRASSAGRPSTPRIRHTSGSARRPRQA